MTGTHTNENGQLPTNEEILAALIAKADLEDAGNEVRDCLRTYKLNATEKAQRNALNKFAKDTLIKTMQFLNANNKNLSSMLKSNIAIELTCRIQNLLLETCGICGIDFATSLEEPLLLQCELCGQNIHTQCLKKLLGNKFYEGITPKEVKLLLNPFGLQGIHYLCNSCSKATIPQNFHTEDDESNLDNLNNAMLTHDQAHPEDTDVINQHNLNTNEGSWRERSDLCTLFLQGTCEHGISGKNCEHFHPHVCTRYRKNGTHPKYGCRLNNACKDYHPAICPNSLKSHTCYNSDCKYKWHLPRTARATPSAYGRNRYTQNYGRRRYYQRTHQTQYFKNSDNTYQSHGYMHAKYQTKSGASVFNRNNNFNHNNNFSNQGYYPETGHFQGRGLDRGQGPHHNQALDVPHSPNLITNLIIFLF